VIPGWKVKRELTRLGQQLRAIPEAIWEPFFYGRYDRSFPSELTIHQGKVPLVDQVALVLIYPRPVLPESTVNLCRSLAQAGRSPLVISNAPLGADLLAQLAPHAWRLVERPNIGHDFGGYRDGIWLLWRWGVEPESLLILNDSVWLLLNDATELIGRLNAAGGDVAGSILRQRGEERFLESYCYLVRAKALRSPAFRDFWAQLRLSSNKYKVIRRGERAHSAALIAGGLQLAPAFDNVAFWKGLDSVDDDTLAQTLKFAAWPSPREAAAANDLLAHRLTPGWRENALEFIQESLKRGQFYSMFPVAAHGIIGYPFLKRSSDRVASLWRKAFLSAVKAGALKRPDPIVLAEIEARVAMDV
jgi:hypothetical protein